MDDLTAKRKKKADYMRVYIRKRYHADPAFKKKLINDSRRRLKEKWAAMTVEERKAYSRARYLSPTGQRAASRMMLKQQFGITEVPEAMVEIHVLRRAIKKEVFK